MIRDSQPQNEKPGEAEPPGLTIERIAFDEIHPAFLDTLDNPSVPTVTGIKKVVYLFLAALFFILGVLGCVGVLVVVRLPRL